MIHPVVVVVFCLVIGAIEADVDGLNPSQRTLLLQLHNDLRSTIANGNMKVKYGTKLPAAANMIELVSNDLSRNLN